MQMTQTSRAPPPLLIHSLNSEIEQKIVHSLNSEIEQKILLNLLQI